MTAPCLDMLFLEITLLVSIIDLAASFLLSFFPLMVVIRIFLGFIVLTYVLGASIRVFLRIFAKCSAMPSTFTVAGFAFDLLLSLIANLAISVILAGASLLYDTYLLATAIALIVTLNSLTILVIKRKRAPACTVVSNEKAQARPKESKVGIAIALVILLVASSLSAAYFRSKTPFPTINGWDINSSLAYVNWITTHHGFNYVMIPSFPSGGIPYPALFFFVISSYSLFLGVEPYLLFWYSIYPLVFGYMVIVFLIALRLSKNLWLSIMSSFIAFFTSTATAEVVRSPLYLTLDMLSQLIFLLIIVFNIYSNGRGTGKKLFNLLLVFYLALFNYFTAIAVFPFLVWIVLDNDRIPLLGNGRKAFRITALSMVTGALILIALGGYAIPTFASLFSSSEVPISSKVEILQDIYPAYFRLLFGVALLSIIINWKYLRRTDSLYLDMLLYILCGLFLYFLPAWITYRFEFYFRVFLAVSVSSLGLLFERGFFAKTVAGPFRRLRNKEVHLGGIASVVLLIVTVAQMYPLFVQYSPYAYISNDEYNAFEWIWNNTSSTAYMLTDPSSGYVIRALSLRNASTYFILPDGRMPADSSTLYPDLKASLVAFLSSQTGEEWVEVTDLLKLTPIYIVVTSRTVAWAHWPSDNAMTHPLEGLNYSFVTSKFTEPYFTEVYTSDTVKIYNPNR